MGSDLPTAVGMISTPLRVALGVVLAAGVGAAVIPSSMAHADQREAARMRSIATSLRDPAGSVPLPARQCHGDGYHRCASVPRPVDAVAAEVVSALRAAAGQEPAVRCETLHPSPEQAVRSCQVRLGGSHHAVVVFVDESARRGGAASGHRSVVRVSSS